MIMFVKQLAHKHATTIVTLVSVFSYIEGMLNIYMRGSKVQ